jgi:hypothetical protein
VGCLKQLLEELLIALKLEEELMMCFGSFE